ncbi:hypothetical protein Asal01_03388 [Fodinibius salicampi]
MFNGAIIQGIKSDAPLSSAQGFVEQANAHHRSINGEIIACLERSVKPQQFSTDDILQCRFFESFPKKLNIQRK